MDDFDETLERLLVEGTECGAVCEIIKNVYREANCTAAERVGLYRLWLDFNRFIGMSSPGSEGQTRLHPCG